LPVFEPRPAAAELPEDPARPGEDTAAPPRDTLGRALHDLRISVTDRCNFRCVYCMPKEVFGKDFEFLPKGLVLTFEEIERLARIFVGLGVEKLRITGGEPLVRRDRRVLIEASILPMARWARAEGLILRFIEYMDVGHSNGWRMDDVVPAAEILARIDAETPLSALPPNYSGEVATRWRYRDGSGEVGVIASVSEPFCSTCTRARLSAEGKLYTCLFAVAGHDLRALLRGGRSDAEIEAAIRRV